MKYMGPKKRNSRKMLKMIIFKLLSLYAHYPIFLIFYFNNLDNFYIMPKYKKKFESTNVGFTQL